MWRDDINDDSPATISTFIICAIDENVNKSGSFSLDILHVRSSYGKGFVPRINNFGRLHFNGFINIGIDEKTYNEALKDGKELMIREKNRFEKETKEYKE